MSSEKREGLLFFLESLPQARGSLAPRRLLSFMCPVDLTGQRRAGASHKTTIQKKIASRRDPNAGQLLATRWRFVRCFAGEARQQELPRRPADRADRQSLEQAGRLFYCLNRRMKQKARLK